MTGNELKDALMDGRPVKYNEIEYKRISAIIYRCVDGKIDVTAELLDKNGPFVVIARGERVTAA